MVVGVVAVNDCMVVSFSESVDEWDGFVKRVEEQRARSIVNSCVSDKDASQKKRTGEVAAPSCDRPRPSKTARLYTIIS